MPFRRWFGDRTASVDEHVADSGSSTDIQDLTVFYTFSFDIGHGLDPVIAARALLETDLAIAAPSYEGNDIEVATRMKSLLALRRQLRDIRAVNAHLQSGSWLRSVGWVLRHPVRSSRLLRAAIASRHAAALLDSEATSTPPDVGGTVDDAERFIADAMSRIGGFEALQRYVDRELLSPRYLKDTPFTRVGLQPFYVTIGGREIAGDAGVLIHRSGVAILTFYVQYEGQMGIDEAVRLTRSTDDLQLEKAEFVEALLSSYAGSLGVSSDDLKIARDFRSGVGWARFEEPSGETLSDLLQLYAALIASAVQRRPPRSFDEPWVWSRADGWKIYPIVFVRGMNPPTRDGSDLEQRRGALVPLLLRQANWQDYSDAVIESLPSDQAGLNDYSLFVGPGHAVVVNHEAWRTALVSRYGDLASVPGQVWLIREFNTSALLEMVLVEDWIMEVIRGQVESLPLDSSGLASLRSDLLLALDEYLNVPAYSYGSAQGIHTQARADLGVDEKYRGLSEMLKVWERAVEAEDARRKYQRARAVQVLTLLGVLVLGLPSAVAAVESVAAWVASPIGWPPWLASWIDSLAGWVSEHQTLATLLAYGFIVLVSALAIFLLLTPARRSKAVSVRRATAPAEPGFVWPDRPSIEIVDRDMSADADAEGHHPVVPPSDGRR